MAVGVTYFGAGTRPIKKTTDEEFNFDPTEGGTSTLVDTSTSGGGSVLSGKASLLRAQTERDKLIAEQQAAADAITRAQKGAASQLDYLTGLSTGVPQNIIDLLGGQREASESYVNKQYENLMNQLAGAYTRGEQLTTTGYNALRDYLTKNPPTAFQQPTQVAPTTVGNDLAAYMAGQRVSTAPVTPTIEALNAAASGGAQNYSQLLDTLARAQTAGQESRLSEEQMARTLAGAQLGQLRASQEGSLQQQQLAALAQIQAEQAAARIQAEQAATARNQAIEDAIAGLVGTGYVCPPGFVKDASGNCVPEPKAGTGTVDINQFQPATVTPVQQLAAKLSGIQKTGLRQNIGNFIAANPAATAEAIRARFPQLGASIQ